MRKSQKPAPGPPFPVGTRLRYRGTCAAWYVREDVRVQITAPGMEVKITEVSSGATVKGRGQLPTAGSTSIRNTNLDGRSFYDVPLPDGSTYRQPILAGQRMHWEQIG